MSARSGIRGKAHIASIDARGTYQYRARNRRKVGNRVVIIFQNLTNLTDAQTWAMIQGKVVSDEYVDRKLVQATTVRQRNEVTAPRSPLQ